MKAKIMTLDEENKLFSEWKKLGESSRISWRDYWLQAQDKISFKAGYDKRKSEFVYNPSYLDFQKGSDMGKEFGRLAGIKEVVEWIKGKRLFMGVEWQAKLREWFKDQPELLKEWG